MVTTNTNTGRATAPAGYSLPYLLSYLAGPGSRVTATLQAHCHAAYNNRLAANKFSPARGLLRGVNLGAVSMGAGRYPALPGSVYHAALSAAAAGAKPEATMQAVRTALQACSKVWAGTPHKATAAQRVQQQLKAAAATRAGGKAAKRSAGKRAARRPTAEPTVQATAEPTVQATAEPTVQAS